MSPMTLQYFRGIFILGLAALLLGRPASAEEKGPFFYTLQGELLGGYSDIEGRDGEFSSIDNWLFSPSWKLSDKLFFINSYNGTYDRSAQVVAQEEGGRQTNTTQTHSLNTSLKYFVNERWSLRPFFFADWIFVNETRDESFGEGLYDYEQLGGGVESTWSLLKTDTREDELKLSFRYLGREYPNYRSLLSLFNRNGSIETNEKDLDGYKVSLGGESRTKNGWAWGLEGIFFYKDYTDKKIIDSNGIRDTSNTREDFVEYVNVYISHPINEGWSWRLDGQFSANQSNLDFYDTHNSPTFGDDDFIKDYFDFYSFQIKPSLLYVKQWAEDRRFFFTLDYTFNALLYDGRRAQDISGRYGSEDEENFTHTVSGKTSVPINKNISWVVYGNYTVADSNQDFESFYLYNYNLWTAVTGISIKY